MKKDLFLKDRRNFFSKILMVGFGGLALLLLYGGPFGKDLKTMELTEDQKDSLFYIYQEEKVARDVYTYLGDLYPDENTFAYIQLSEQRHIDTVEKLCIKYNVDISAVDETDIGVFVLPELQDLYDQLIVDGSTSLFAALQVGIHIEETDIADLEEASAGMPSDVVKVFDKIKEGSLNHLEAFTQSIVNLE